jgi:hypothetical protein
VRPGGNPAIVAVLTVHAVIDPAPVARAARGRWVLVDWEMRNVGAAPFAFERFQLLLQTEPGLLIEPDYFPGHPEPVFPPTLTLPPGFAVRGLVAYDVPAGQRPAAALVRSARGGEFLVAALAQVGPAGPSRPAPAQAPVPAPAQVPRRPAGPAP